MFVLPFIVSTVTGMENSLWRREDDQLEKLVKPLAKQAYKKVEKILFDRRGPLCREDRSNLRRFFRENGDQIKNDFEEAIEGVIFGADGLHVLLPFPISPNFLNNACHYPN